MVVQIPWAAAGVTEDLYDSAAIHGRQDGRPAAFLASKAALSGQTARAAKNYITVHAHTCDDGA